MTRHPYATNSEERKRIPFFLAVLAVASAFALSAVYSTIKLSPPTWLDAPGTMAIYGSYYWLFKKYVWKWKLLRKLGLVSTPILAGTWVGQMKTSHDEDSPIHEVTVEIGQDWTEILIRLRSEYSQSHSTSASITISEDNAILIYEYLSEPNPDAVPGLQIHYGTARVEIAEDNRMDGNYYTGRGRLNIGSLVLRRT